jgi:hypothetical protein
MRALYFLPVLLLACSGSSDGGDTDDTNDPEAKAVTLTMVSPEDGKEYPYEDALPLHVEAKREGKAVAIESATWTIGAWTGEGKETEASGLDPGAYTVSVDAVVGGETYTASVDITIAEPVQTLFAYSGTFDADVVVTSEFGDFEDHCSTPISFTVDTGVISGSGTCSVFDEYGFDPLSFTMEGTVRGGNIAGDLVMAVDGEEARTPFSGTGRAGEALSASFDTTHRSADGSVRIVGTWSGSPQ